MRKLLSPLGSTCAAPPVWDSVQHVYRRHRRYVRQYVYWKLRLDPIYGHIGEVCPKAGHIVEAGCGYAIMSNILCTRSPERRLTAVDRDPAKIEVARSVSQAMPAVRVEQADLFTWAFPQADCVLLIDVLHYWSGQKQRELAGKAALCLKPGGMLVFRDGMATQSRWHRLTVLGERFTTRFGCNRKGDGLYFNSYRVWRQIFEEKGLELIGEPAGWGRGSNAALIFGKPDAAGAAPKMPECIAQDLRRGDG